MRMIFDKLWDKILAQQITRTQFRLKAGISAVTLAKLGRDETVSHATLLKICAALNCDIYDILTYAAQPPARKYKKR